MPWLLPFYPYLNSVPFNIPANVGIVVKGGEHDRPKVSLVFQYEVVDNLPDIISAGELFDEAEDVLLVGGAMLELANEGRESLSRFGLEEYHLWCLGKLKVLKLT